MQRLFSNFIFLLLLVPSVGIGIGVFITLSSYINLITDGRDQWIKIVAVFSLVLIALLIGWIISKMPVIMRWLAGVVFGLLLGSSPFWFLPIIQPPNASTIFVPAKFNGQFIAMDSFLVIVIITGSLIALISFFFLMVQIISKKIK